MEQPSKQCNGNVSRSDRNNRHFESITQSPLNSLGEIPSNEDEATTPQHMRSSSASSFFGETTVFCLKIVTEEQRSS